jgi:DNA polymerase III epsilon subunit-like protein
MVVWPEGWTDRHYNGNEPCDVLVGTCSCGAWHNEHEEWVSITLFNHNATIMEANVPLFCPQCHRELSIPEHFTGLGLSCGMCMWLGDAADALKELPSIIKMPYVSIDLETTGLDPQECQILQLGAVYDDGKHDVADLPTFCAYVSHERYTGQPYALALNAAILKRLSGATAEDYARGTIMRPDDVAGAFRSWLMNHCGWDGKASLTPAGKNFASFDKGFLEMLCDWKENVNLSHRCIDPATYYWKPESDDKLPDSKTCMERAGIGNLVAHTAVEDALMVVRLIRIGVRRRAGQ